MSTDRDYKSIRYISRYDLLNDLSENFYKKIFNIFGQRMFCLSNIVEFNDNSENLPKYILTYYLENIANRSIQEIYTFQPIESIHFIGKPDMYFPTFQLGYYLGVPYIRLEDDFVKRLSNTGSKSIDQNNDIYMQQFIDYVSKQTSTFESRQKTLINCRLISFELYKSNKEEYIKNFIHEILKDSFYPFIFDCAPSLEYVPETHTLILDYTFPLAEEIPNQFRKEYAHKSDELKSYPISQFKKIYEEILATITIRTIAEIFHFDSELQIENVCFNGCIVRPNTATGIIEKKCILSLLTTRKIFSSLNLEYIEPIETLHYLKAVKAKKLYDAISITPIQKVNYTDNRIVEAKAIDVSQYSNLAEMDWEDFEHLVRQVFEWEFSNNGSEVNITQASRDGGVDAIVFDPDPIRGGKIVIQAKRYTNTVGVSAVRDLYGTIINEGANKGILITTSDYGADSYKFAQGKPITLLNGGHLLYLLEKHGKNATINLAEAKKHLKGIK